MKLDKHWEYQKGMICPNCKSTNVKPAIMLEEGIEYPIDTCEDCAWWL